MKKPENIYVSLQLRKDQASEGVLLDIHFNAAAPNFTVDRDAVSWCPTIEELDFIAEVFNLIAKGKRGTDGKSQETTTESTATRQIDEASLLDRVMDKKDRRAYSTTER